METLIGNTFVNYSLIREGLLSLCYRMISKMGIKAYVIKDDLLYNLFTYSEGGALA